MIIRFVNGKAEPKIYEVPEQTKTIVIKNGTFFCARCMQHIPMTKMGMRNMGKSEPGVLRNQPVCSSCR